jgi:sugar (pentulose or hexulose) kinase
MEYVLGIDLGTSYFKLGLFTRDGDMAGLGRVAVTKESGDGDRSEIPVDQFWNLLKQGLNEACSQAGISPEQIKALSYASQANSFLLLDGNKNPLTPVVLWCDDRAENMDGIEDLFFRSDFIEDTGMGLTCSHQFCAAKLLWFQRYQPDLWSRTAYIATVSDYFTYAMTDRFAGDTGTASLLGMLNIRTRTWRFDIVDLEGKQRPTPFLPGTVIGNVTGKMCDLVDLPRGIPFVLGSLDHHMAGVGAGLGTIADMSESTGTVLACINLINAWTPRNLVCTGTGIKENHYFQLAFDDNGAAPLEWYQHHQAPELSIPELERLAENVDIGSDGIFVQPAAHQYAGLNGFYGVEQHHGHGHFARAIMESTAFSLRELTKQLFVDYLPGKIVATGGGARSDLWLQIKSDLLNADIIRTKEEEPACMGAAMLAALGAAWYPELADISNQWIEIENRFTPVTRNNHRYAQLYDQWKKSTRE